MFLVIKLLSLLYRISLLLKLKMSSYSPYCISTSLCYIFLPTTLSNNRLKSLQTFPLYVISTDYHTLIWCLVCFLITLTLLQKGEFCSSHGYLFFDYFGQSYFYLTLKKEWKGRRLSLIGPITIRIFFLIFLFLFFLLSFFLHIYIL